MSFLHSFRFCFLFSTLFNSFQSFHRLRGNCETKKYMKIVSWELQSRRLDVFWCCCLASSSVNGEVKRKLEDTPTHLAMKKVTWNELHYFGTFGTWWFHDFIAVLISSLPSMSFSMSTSMYSWLQVSATFIWVKSQRSACEGKRRQWDMFPTQSRYLSLDLGVKNAMRLFIVYIHDRMYR